MGHLSIDFRDRGIRLLETEGNLKSLKISKFCILKAAAKDADILDDESAAEALDTALGHVLSKNNFAREPAGMALGSSYCFFRDLELPFKSDDQIRKVIKFEVEGSIQADIDDVVITHYKKTESLDKSHLLVTGAKKSVLMKQLKLLEKKNVDPYFIDLDLLSFYNALSATGYLKENDCFLVINITDWATHILVLNRERLTSARTIPLGVNELCRALEHDLKMARINAEDGVEALLEITSLKEITTEIAGTENEDDETVESVDEPSGEPLSSRSQEAKELVKQRRLDFINKLKRELIRSFTFLDPEEKPQKVFITGSGCCMPGISELLEELFGTEVEELDLLSRVEHAWADDSKTIDAVNREIAIPLGTAFKTAGHNMTRVDFRQEEARYSKKFDQIKVPLACLVFLLLILVVLLNLEQYMLRKAKNWEMDQITTLAGGALKTALEDIELADKLAEKHKPGMDRINGITRGIESKSRSLGDLLGREGTIPELPSAFPIWHRFFSVIEEHQDDFELFRLTKLQIKMLQKIPTLTFSCEVASGEDTSKLQDYLEAVPIFTKVKPGVSRAREDVREVTDIEVDIDLSKEDS